MPTYHALDTTVNLCIWDPRHAQSSKIVETAANDAVDLGKQSPSDPLRAIHPRKSDGLSSSAAAFDPARGLPVEVLKEEYFEGHEGFHVLGDDIPFYLINAGKDLFLASHSPFAGRKSELPRKEPTEQVSEIRKESGVDVVPIQRLRESSLRLLPSPNMIIKGRRPGAVTTKDGKSIQGSLAAIETSILSSPPRPPVLTAARHGTSAAVPSLRIKDRNVGMASQKSAILGPINSPLPLQVRITLSKQSFMRSILTEKRHEICVIIFYNGELSHSRIIKDCAANPSREDLSHYYAGRRVTSLLEVPWAVVPYANKKSESRGGKKFKHLSFAERWEMVSQMLLVESEEWKESGSKTRTGQCLEEIAKAPIPKSLEKIANPLGNRAGIIDVVIALGTSTSINLWAKHLKKPSRKLPEKVCGLDEVHVVVPVESIPRKKDMRNLDDQPETNHEEGFTSDVPGSSTLLGASITPARTVEAASTAKPFQSQENLENIFDQSNYPSTQQRQQGLTNIDLSVGKPMVKVLPTPRSVNTRLQNGSPSVQQNRDSQLDSRAFSSSPHEVADDSDTGPIKRRKIHNSFEHLPSNTERTTALSTLSMPRSAATLEVVDNDVRVQPLVRGDAEVQKQGLSAAPPDSQIQNNVLDQRITFPYSTGLLTEGGTLSMGVNLNPVETLSSFGSVPSGWLKKSLQPTDGLKLDSHEALSNQGGSLANQEVRNKNEPLLVKSKTSSIIESLENRVSGGLARCLRSERTPGEIGNKDMILQDLHSITEETKEGGIASHSNVQPKPRRQRSLIAKRELADLMPEPHRPSLRVDNSLDVLHKTRSRSMSTIPPASKVTVSAMDRKFVIKYAGNLSFGKRLVDIIQKGKQSSGRPTSVGQKREGIGLTPTTNRSSPRSLGGLDRFETPSTGGFGNITNIKLRMRRRSTAISPEVIEPRTAKQSNERGTTTLIGANKLDEKSSSDLKRTTRSMSHSISNTIKVEEGLAPSLSPSQESWKPNELCQDSVLTYAGVEAWPGLQHDIGTNRMCRKIRAEREGLFRTSGILMAVRFVVGVDTGAGVLNEKE